MAYLIHEISECGINISTSVPNGSLSANGSRGRCQALNSAFACIRPSSRSTLTGFFGFLVLLCFQRGVCFCLAVEKQRI